MRRAAHFRSSAAISTLCFLFMVNMTGTWGCEPGKLCGTWLGRQCCEHADDHRHPVTGRTGIDHEDHGCRYSPIASTHSSVATPPAFVSATPTTLMPETANGIIAAAFTGALVPDSRGPPGPRIHLLSSHSLRAPPLS